MSKRKSVERVIKLRETCYSVHKFSKDEIGLFRKSILHWYDKSHRELPWRSKAKEESDLNKRAYAVWVSEVMLQQTQVTTVICYYNKWMQKWPTLQHLATASVQEVNELWSGLGYYSRGQRLHEAACKVVHKLNGQIPHSARELEKLPGVGRYTACAVASIALGECTGLVDGNVSRVLSRLRIIGADISTRTVTAELWKLADSTVDPDRPGDFNQALMELGATVCTPKNPNCSACPVKSICLARLQEENYKEGCATKLMKTNNGTKSPVLKRLCDIENCELCLSTDESSEVRYKVTSYPHKSKKKPPRIEKTAVCVLSRPSEHDTTEEYLIIQRHHKGLLAQMWEFPSVQISVESSVREAQEAISQYLENMFSVNTLDSTRNYVTEVVHIFSHIRQTYMVEVMSLRRDVKFDASEFAQSIKWVTADEFDDAAVSSAMRKVFKAAMCMLKKDVGRMQNSSSRCVSKDSKKQLCMEMFFSKQS